MKRTLLIIFIAIFQLSLSAQISHEKRIEIELKDDYIGETIMEFGKDGFLLRSKNVESQKGANEWKFELFNTQLESSKIKTVLLGKKFRPIKSFISKERTHTIFLDGKGSFALTTTRASDLEVKIVEGAIPEKISISSIVVLGDYALFDATLKSQPYLFSVNWRTGKLNFIAINKESFSSKKMTTLGFQALEDENEVFLYIKAKKDKSEDNLIVLTFNEYGEKIASFNLSKKFDQTIVDISASKLSENKYVFTGTYSSKISSYAEGIFFCQVYNGDIDYIEFHNFLDLKNFLSYLPEKKKEKIEKKKQKQEGKGKEYNISYRLTVHDIMETETGYLFLGEAFYSTYRTETYTTTSTMNGHTSTTTHTRTVFDGYQYTHAVIAKFNKEGDLEWDETFEMSPTYKPYFVKQFISVTENSENSMNLIFVSKNKIVSKSIDYNGEILSESESNDIETGFVGDKSKSSFSNIDYWYDNYFIAYGNQTIKNTEDKSVKRKRKVFFISKIKFE